MKKQGFILICCLFILGLMAQEDVLSQSYTEVTKKWKAVALNTYNPREGDENLTQAQWEALRTERLLKLGKKRSALIEKDETDISLSAYIDDSLFEIRIIPLKWMGIFKLRYQAISKHLDQGLSGIKNLIPEMMVILLFILLPFIIMKINKWVLDRINEIRRKMSNPYTLTPFRQKVVLLLQRTAPFIPLGLSILGIKAFEISVKQTLFPEFNLLLPYILYYLYYLIFRQALLMFLRFISEFSVEGRSRDQVRQTKAKIFSTSKIIGRVAFWVLVLLHLVSSVAGKGLVYYELSMLFKVLGVFYYFWLVYKWKDEIRGFIKKNTPEGMANLYERFDKGLTAPIVRSLGLIVIAVVPLGDWLENKLLEFNMGKKLLAKLFERKLEGSEEVEDFSGKELPEKYLEWFSEQKDDNRDLWVKSKNQQVDNIVQEIEEWASHKSDEHSLAIYGDKGVGKTLVLKEIEKWVGETYQGSEQGMDVVFANVPAKLTDRKSVLKFLGQLVAGRELNDLAELIEFDKEMKPCVVILDEAHNFFLSQFGGLKGIEAFFETLNVRTDNIFWVACFNTYSWTFLDQVFYKNKYFRSVFRIKGLTDEELQEYILRRHLRTGFSLSYADIIRAVKTSSEADEVTYVENLFFRLLWEQSKGNPELAEKLWLASLRPMRGRRLKVGLPKGRDYSVLSGLSDESFFVLAALLRHENLNSSEFMKVTDMKEGHVRHCLRIGLENGLVIRSDSDRRYRIKVEGQYSVISALKAKNFVYE